jgi:hypothetical protein
VNEFAQDSVVCRHCGAENTPYSKNCWICHRDLAASDLVVADVVGRRPPFAPSEALFMFLTLALVAALAMSVVGMWQQAPGAGIFMMALLSPVIIATLIRGMKRQSKQGYLTWQDRFAVLGSSLVLTIGIIMLVLVAGVILLFLVCLGALPFLR